MPGHVRFPFNREKAVAAAALIIQVEGGRVDVIRIAKLLYLSERESLDAHGWPLLGGDYLSRKHGPVCESAYRMATDQLDLWQAHFSRRGHQVEVVRDPEPSALSEADRITIRRVCERLKDVDDWHLVELTHNLSEWKGPGNQPIFADDILRAVGKSEEEIEAVADLAEDAWQMKAILS